MTTDVIQKIKINDIYLDEQNPRLPTSVSRKQNDMILYIARNTSITELMTAIAENDYFPGEPIVVVPRTQGGYWAVEGNRRLTALKLLRDPSLYPKNTRVAEIAANATFKPDEVPCVVFGVREEVINYLGYRHITGVKQWEPLAKARYIAQYLDSQTNKQSSAMERYKEVARGIGSQGPYIKRQLDALAVFRHMEAKGFYRIDSLTEESVSFSLLSTAVGYESILKYLSSDENPYLNPAALDDQAVENFATWLFLKNDEGETVLGDSRNIQRLAVIVQDADALKVLVEDRNFTKAFALTKGVSIEFNDLLVEISQKMADAMAAVALIELDDGHIAKIGDIMKLARALRAVAEDPK